MSERFAPGSKTSSKLRCGRVVRVALHYRVAFFPKGSFMVRSVYLGASSAARVASDLDRQIVDALTSDGRISGREIAQRIGVSEATVSRRLATLEEEGLVVVRGFIEPKSVGCTGLSLARFVVDGDSAAAASALARQTGFHRVSRVDGGQQLTALVVGSTPAMVLDHIDIALSTISMLRLERASEVLCVLPPGCTPPDAFTIADARVPRQAAIQAKLLQAVQTNIRQSLNHVSEAIKASPSATRANLQRMIETRVVRPVVATNPHFMGTPVVTQLRMSPRAAFRESLTMVRELLPHAWIFQCIDNESIVAESAFECFEAVELRAAAIRNALANADVSAHLLLEVHSDLFDWWCDSPCKSAK